MDVWVAFEVGFAVCQMWLIRLHTHPYTPRALSHTCTQFHTDGDYRRINMSKCLAVITVSWQSWTWISAHTPTEELRESIVSHLLVHTSFVLLKWGNKNIFWFKCVFLLILNNPVTCNFIVLKNLKHVWWKVSVPFLEQRIASSTVHMPIICDHFGDYGVNCWSLFPDPKSASLLQRWMRIINQHTKNIYW